MLAIRSARVQQLGALVTSICNPPAPVAPLSAMIELVML